MTDEKMMSLGVKAPASLVARLDEDAAANYRTRSAHILSILVSHYEAIDAAEARKQGRKAKPAAPAPEETV